MELINGILRFSLFFLCLVSIGAFLDQFDYIKDIARNYRLLMLPLLFVAAMALYAFIRTRLLSAHRAIQRLVRDRYSHRNGDSKCPPVIQGPKPVDSEDQ